MGLFAASQVGMGETMVLYKAKNAIDTLRGSKPSTHPNHICGLWPWACLLMDPYKCDTQNHNNPNTIQKKLLKFHFLSLNKP